jgi:phage shock protein C
MFCGRCGVELAAGARFCSACGAPVAQDYTTANAAPPPRSQSWAQSSPQSSPQSWAVPPMGGDPLTRLVRPRANRMVAGVCAGLARHYRWDLTWVRVLTVLIAVFSSGAGLVAYVVFWIVMPEEPWMLQSPTAPPSSVSDPYAASISWAGAGQAGSAQGTAGSSPVSPETTIREV